MMTTHIKIAKFAAADAAHLEKALEAVPKVSSVAVKPSENLVVVEHDGADQGEMSAAIRQLGYVPDFE